MFVFSVSPFLFISPPFTLSLSLSLSNFLSFFLVFFISLLFVLLLVYRKTSKIHETR